MRGRVPSVDFWVAGALGLVCCLVFAGSGRDLVCRAASDSDVVVFAERPASDLTEVLAKVELLSPIVWVFVAGAFSFIGAGVNRTVEAAGDEVSSRGASDWVEGRSSVTVAFAVTESPGTILCTKLLTESLANSTTLSRPTQPSPIASARYGIARAGP